MSSRETGSIATGEQIDQHHRKILGVMSLENALQVILLFSGALVCFANVKSDVRDTNTKLESTREEVAELKRSSQENHDALLNMGGDVRVIRQAIEQYQKSAAGKQ